MVTCCWGLAECDVICPCFIMLQSFLPAGTVTECFVHGSLGWCPPGWGFDLPFFDCHGTESLLHNHHSWGVYEFNEDCKVVQGESKLWDSQDKLNSRYSQLLLLCLSWTVATNKNSFFHLQRMEEEADGLLVVAGCVCHVEKTFKTLAGSSVFLLHWSGCNDQVNELMKPWMTGICVTSCLSAHYTSG